jgi:hypothetical protein
MKTLTMRRRTMLLSGLAVGLGAATPSLAEDDKAPFGLIWGMSPDDVQTHGAKLVASDGRNYGKSFNVTGLDHVLSDAEAVLLSFGYHDKLFRIVVAGKQQGPDPYGFGAMQRYNDLASIMTERYGKGTETDIRDFKMWKDPNEYVMSLKQGRAHRFTLFRTAIVNVELSVRAESGDYARYVIIFTNTAGAEVFEADKRRQERDSL